MKTTISRLLSVGLLFCTVLFSCESDKPAPPPDTSVKLVSFSPASGAENSTVVLIGSNFAAQLSQNQVQFNGTTAEVLSVNSTKTELSVQVPYGATSGKITISVVGKTVSSTTDFTINPLSPTITGMTPDKGSTATVVEITGTNFRNGSTVYFNNIASTSTSVNSSTKITATVPSNASTGKVKVITGVSMEALSPIDFYVQPIITSFSPITAKEGDIVTISGCNFATDAAVGNIIKFGSVAVPATDVQVVSATEIKVKVPAGLPITPVKVFAEVKGMIAESSSNFTFIPNLVVTNTSPMHGQEGDEITITGTGLTTVTMVFVGTVQATIKPGTTHTQLVFMVPAGFNGANTNKASIKLVTGSGDQTLPGTFEVTNVWRKMSSYAVNSIEKRYGYTASFYYGDKIYWGFGSNNGGYRNDLFSADMVNNGIAVEQNQDPNSTTQPGIRSVMNSTVFGNKVYIMGGSNHISGVSTNFRDIWEYNITTNSFTKKAAQLPSNADYFPISFVYNNKLYVYMYGNNIGHNIYEYNPVADQFLAAPFMNWVNSPALYYTDVQVIGNTVYFIADKKIQALNMNTQQFTLYTLPSSVQGIGQRGFISYASNGKIYLGGGTCFTCPNNTAIDFHVFDPGSGITTRLADIPQLNHYLSPFGVKNGRGYVVSSNGIYQYIPNY